MSTFDYIRMSKVNVIKMHPREQQIEFIMELNRAVVQCPNVTPIESRITLAKEIHFLLTGFLRLHKRRYVCPCLRSYILLKPSIQRYQRKSKDADADYGVVF